MPFPVTLHFPVFKQRYPGGLEIFIPLADMQTVRMETTIAALGAEYQQAIQQVLDKSRQSLWLWDQIVPQNFTKAKIEVPFPAHKEGFQIPAFSLDFDYFYCEKDEVYWAVVPSLNIEAGAHTPAALHETIKELISIDFNRRDRMKVVQSIVYTAWAEQTSLHDSNFKVQFPDPGETTGASEQEQYKWLNKVGKLIQFKQVQAYGREEIADQCLRTIQGGFPNNLLMLGPNGVGKTAVAWEAIRQLNERSNEWKVWETTASILIKELSKDTGWEFNLSELCQEIQFSKHILYVRNLMELFEVGQYEGNDTSMAQFLMPYLSQGQIRLITECTEEQLAKIEINSPNFPAYFQLIRMSEPNSAELEAIILKKISSTSREVGIVVQEDAVQESIRLHRRFMPYSGMPGRPIRFLEGILLWKLNQGNLNKAIDKSEILKYFCQESGMPRFIVDPGEPLSLELIQRSFKAQVLGQDAAVEAVTNALIAVKAALARTGKPIASFLFAGPTGVGKTELAKVLSEFMFGSRDRMVRFDMSEYGHPQAVLHLAGAGANQEGLLTGAVKRQPFCVLLFDEIEKAHVSFLDLLLQILGEGRLTDGRGYLTDFCSTIIVMTTNLGAGELRPSPGFGNNTPNAEVYLNSLRKHFRPELFARIDQVIAFQSLDMPIIRAIVEREMALLRKRDGFRFRKLEFDIQPGVLDHLAEKGFHSKYGGRYLQRAMRELLILPLAAEMNRYDPSNLLQVKVDVADESLILKVAEVETSLVDMIAKLEQTNNADHASMLRGKAKRFKESYAFTSLLQEMDELEALKTGKKTASKFTHIQDLRLYDLHRLSDRADALEAEINELELNLSLSVLEQETYDDMWNELLEPWEDQFFRLRFDVFVAVFPENNQCHLYLWGDAMEHALPFYQKLSEHKRFKTETVQLWYRESHYYEIIPDPNEIGKTTQRKEYLKHSELESELFQHKSGDRLVGYEFKVKGPAAFYYFAKESGVQKWIEPPHKKEVLTQVLVSREESKLDVEIHKPNLLIRIPIRRHCTFPQLKDNTWRINRELQQTDYLSYLDFQLTQQFRAELEANTE
jgi:ATP-dependent Clp protease ATP-binding subunit ClpA